MKLLNTKDMLRKTLFFIAIIFTFDCAWSQIPGEKVEIGIEEKLGDTIPLNLTFLNENNDTVQLGDLINKPTILSLVYFDCPGICSPLMKGISDVVTNMDMQLGKDYQIITISFNTKDTPEKAAIKKQNFVQKISKENRANWIYLTGDESNIDAITNATGFRYKAQGLDFAHPAAIIMLSPKGKITRYLYGTTFLPFDVKMAIIEAQKGLARPTISKILEYCFAYDPQSRTYALQVTRIIGGFMLAILAIAIIVLFALNRKRSLVKKV
jgi:protein SCO1/2